MDESAIIGLYVIGIILLLAFVYWENRVEEPMINFDLFKIRNFSIANAISIIISFGMLGIFFPMTLFLQQALDFTPLEAGLTMSPISIMIMLTAPIAGRMTDHFGPRWILFTGTSLIAVGISLVIRQIDLDTTSRSLAPAMALAGLGMGMTFSPMTAAAMRDIPSRMAGSASGVLNTSRNLGQILGIAILGSYLQNRITNHVSEGLAAGGSSQELIDEVADLAGQNRFSDIIDAIPVDAADGIMLAVRQGFADSVHDTFLVGTVACILAAIAALMMRNPTPKPVVVPTPKLTEQAYAD